MVLGPVSSSFIDNIVQEFNNADNQIKIQKFFLDPVLKHIIRKMKPYINIMYMAFFITMLIFILNVILFIKSL